MAKSKKGKLREIETFVRQERKRLGITKLAEQGPPELSCFSFGEFYNLLWTTLMRTPEHTWETRQGMNDPEIIDGVYEEMTRTKEDRKKERNRLASAS